MNKFWVFYCYIFFMSKKILGFDISSKCIGWGLIELTDSNELIFVKCGMLKPIKSQSILERIIHTRNKINEILIETKPDYIGVEDLIKFMPKTTNTSIVMLTTFNRMVCLACADFLGSNPELLNVLSIRHGLKENKIFPQKHEMPELVAKHLSIKFPYLFNKKNNIIEENYDIADGIAVALYYGFILSGRKKQKKKKDKKKK